MFGLVRAARNRRRAPLVGTARQKGPPAQVLRSPPEGEQKIRSPAPRASERIEGRYR